jgi:amino-acid N-acetyltransferase
MKIQIRPATLADVDAIFQLTNRMSQNGFMLPRSKYKIVTMITNFMVAEAVVPEENASRSEAAIIGCGAFSPLWTDLGEICALAVDEGHQAKGIGRDLVNALIERGRELHVPEIMALTYQVEFFKKLGFKVADKDKFPRKVWRECLECPKLEQCDETAVHLLL